MKNCRLGIIFLTVIVFSVKVSVAQSPQRGSEIKKSVVNFKQLAEYYKAHPQPQLLRKPVEEADAEESKPVHPEATTGIHLFSRAPGTTISSPVYGVPLLPVSPPPVDTFVGCTSPVSSIPPDTHGAVDSQYCISAVNTGITIRTRAGALISGVGLDGFWSSVLPSDPGIFTTDPRIHYDPHYKRWIIVTDVLSSPSYANSNIMIGVSKTNDPTGDWYLYAVAVDPTNASWLDYPNVGFNSKWIVVNGNMFPNSPGGASGASVFVFDYVSIMTGAGAPYTRFDKPSSFSICPAQTNDPTEPNMYCVESWSGSAGQLQLWKISGPVASPSMTSLGFPATSQHWRGNPPGGGADFATQAGTTNKVQTGDDRFTSLKYINHTLWCSHTVILPYPGTATRSSIMWWQLDTTGVPLQIGMIDDPATPTFFDYSSIAVNDSNDAFIGFSVLNHTMYPSAGYAMHLHTDPADSIRPPHIFRHGQAQYYTSYGGSQDRWGDYSNTCLDPRNNMDFWTTQEASNNFGVTANWDTWWANYQFCPKPKAPTVTYAGSPCIGDTANYIIDSIPGATSYQWYVAGGGWTGSSTSTRLNATAGDSSGTIVVLAYNACGEGESALLTVVPATPPATPSIGVITPPCTGTVVAEFAASGTGGFIWSVVGSGWSGTGSSYTYSTTVGTGTAMIICTATNACGASAPDTLTITPGTPVDTFTASTLSTLINTNVTLTFAGSAPPGSIYTWNFGGGIGTPGTGPGPQTVHWTTGGFMTVTLMINNYGCNATFSQVIYVKDPTGVANINNLQNDISLSPNPSDGLFDITFTNPVTQSVTVKMTDIDGRTVYNQEFGKISNNKIHIKAGSLTPGNYTVSIISEEGSVTKKITISK